MISIRLIAVAFCTCSVAFSFVGGCTKPSNNAKGNGEPSAESKAAYSAAQERAKNQGAAIKSANKTSRTP